MTLPPPPQWSGQQPPAAAFGTWNGAPQQATFLVSVGDVHATATEIITPSGTFPLNAVNVTAFDQTHTTQKTPTWAIVMAVVTFWFALLGLLFLLAKEQVTQGYVALTIESGGRRHTSQIPVSNAAQRADVMQRAAYLQQLAGRSRQGF